jgi:hypothetical protein
MDSVALAVEVAGCPTICMHCWAQGTRYGSMAIEDVRWLVDQLHDFAAESGTAVRPYPMHEVLAHLDAAEILRLFSSFPEPEFEPLATTGVPFAIRSDWDELVAAASDVGTTTIWVALHGPSDEHDRQAGRRGAFKETRLGVERARRGGLRVGGNVFLTKANVRPFDALAGALESLQLDEVAIGPADFLPTKRGRRYAAAHPELDDLLPVAGRVLELTSFHRAEWSDLPQASEARWVENAVSGDWPQNGRNRLELVCRPNLDLHTGMAGAYGPRHGNLRRDGFVAVFERALARGPVTVDELLLPGVQVRSVRDVAERYGNPDGREVHFTAESMRLRWLDRAAEATG